MPTGRDASLVCSTLAKAGIPSQSCENLSILKDDIRKGVGAVLIAEEVFKNGALEELYQSLFDQPLWSDVPVVLFAANARNAERLLENVGTRFNATIVERPIRITMLISAVRGALRARQKQYETRDLLNELEQADKQKDLFLATLSHELRTPLNSIIGWIRLLRETESRSVDLSHGLDVIERNAKAQAELISDILFISRVITGKLELEREIADIEAIVQNAIEDVKPLLDARNINLVLDVAGGAPTVYGDIDRLGQVFWNLISNAVKFTPEGGRIDIRIKQENRYAVVEIEDTGRGIDPKFLPYIFDRFRQADATYTRRVGGLGLGLAIVHHLVNLHDGSVSAKSEGLGKGSVFTVVLPTDTHEKQASRMKRHKPSAPGQDDVLKGVRALLIEDDPDSREMLAVLLEQYGMRVTTVGSAAAATGILEIEQPEIIISDVGLPGEDGYDLIRKIRSLPASAGGSIPAIAVTGYVSIGDRARAIDAGYQEHVAKPVDIDLLIDITKKLVGERGNAVLADK